MFQKEKKGVGDDCSPHPLLWFRLRCACVLSRFAPATDIVRVLGQINFRRFGQALATGVLSSVLFAGAAVTVTPVVSTPTFQPSSHRAPSSQAGLTAQRAGLGSLQVSAHVAGYSTSAVASGWLTENSEEMFEAGSRQAVVVYDVTNISEKSIDVQGLHVLGSFTGQKHYAATDLNSGIPEHEVHGYKGSLFDVFKHADAWVIEAGETVSFAETIYVEGDGEYSYQYYLPVAGSKTEKSEPVSIQL